MRFHRFAGALVLSAVAATFASATPDQDLRRTLAQSAANMEKGDSLLAETSKLHTNAERLQTLDRALYFLRRARTLAVVGDPQFDKVRTDASQSTIRALDDEADIYYWRSSLTMAGKRVQEALAIDPTDTRSRALGDKIAAANASDLYEDVGGIELQRIRERRRITGIPLRDRGVGRRR
jgi:hypothetical protein